MSLSPREVVDELSQLSADQIAERFELLGIKGRILDSCFCPIANYMSCIFEGRTSASPIRITVWDIYGNSISTPLKEEDPIEQFMIKFDNGGYEGLIDGSNSSYHTC